MGLHHPKMERVAGIEPACSAWKADVLPLNYTRGIFDPIKMVEGGGFEPPKAEPSDLQSDPFGRSGTPPNLADYCLLFKFGCQHRKHMSIKVFIFHEDAA